MFRAIISPVFRSTRLCVTACGIMHPRCCAPEDGRNNFPKHVELTGINNKPLLLHLVGCLYYSYQWCAVKQISDNEIHLLIKCIKSLLWRVAKGLPYIEDARCLKGKYARGKERLTIQRECCCSWTCFHVEAIWPLTPSVRHWKKQRL